MLGALGILGKFAPVLIKYWPIIRLVLEALRNNQGLIAGLEGRPETSPETDARDIFRELDGVDYWDKVGEDGN